MTIVDTSAATPERRCVEVLQNMAGAILWESDPFALEFSFVSDSAAALLGYSLERWRAESRFGFLSKHVPAEDWNGLLSTLYRAAAEQRLQTCEHRLLRSDGTSFWVQTSVHGSRTNGTPITLNGVTVNITGRRVAGDDEAYRGLVVETMRDFGVFTLSLDGKVETWAWGARRVTGYGPQDIEEAGLASFFEADDGGKVPSEQLIVDAHVNGHASYEGWLVRKGGERFWGTVTLGALVDGGNRRGFSCIVRDLTERKTAEQQLRSSEEHFHQLLESLHDYGVFMVAASGNVETWNRGAMRVEGYRSHEIIGKPFGCLFPEDEQRLATPERLLEEAGRMGSASYDGWLVRKGGARFWASLTLSCIEDEDGRLRGLSVVARDLTERQQTDLALRKSEQHFRLLVESLQEYAMFMVSTDGVIESWNRGAQRVKGFRAEEIVGRHFSRFFPAAEVEAKVPERLVREADLRGLASYEGWLVRKGGETFWASMVLSAVEDEDGRLIGFSDVCRDLSQRKHTEEALRQSEERVRLLLESLQGYAVFMVSPDGIVASWPRGAERVKGFRREEVIGTRFSRFFSPAESDGDMADRLIERASREGRAEYEGWLLHKSGGAIWGSLTLSAVRDERGKLLGFSSVERDLTERMRAERAQTFLSHASAVLAGSLDFHTTLDKVARLATGELAQCCVVGMIAGDTDEVIEAVAIAHVEPDKERALNEALGTIPDPTGAAHGIGYVVRTGQSDFYPDVSDLSWIAETFGPDHFALLQDLGIRSYMCVPMIARGKTFGAIALFATSMGRRYRQDDLVLAEELARRAALAADNARLYEQAQNAVCMREDILAVVSHDLRNPLAVIQMSANEVLTQVESQADLASAKDMVDRIQRSAERMHYMIRDLLDFSTIDSGRLTINVTEQDLHELVSEAIDMIVPLARKSGIHLEDLTTDVEARVRCDRDRVLQVLSNLVGNAIKFTCHDGRVSVSAQLVRDKIEVCVADNGPGIAPEELPHIFDRYWHTNRRDQGLGLGLAIAKGILEAHGETVRVESTVARGTSFFFTLPLARDPRPRAA
jgi:PAS domain S-box-containing protein